MKIYLAGTEKLSDELFQIVSDNNAFILNSFYFLRKSKDFSERLSHYGSFMLDSGAYTFRNNNSTQNTDWIAYIKEYAEFINKYNIQLFFELDIDSIVGYEKVLEYRKLLENLTGKKPIPVWHPNRGFAEFEKSCKEYPYVALGGFAGANKAYRFKYQSLYPIFIDTAHKYNAKIHGLGFTSLVKLEEYKFDSVDSTTWTAGLRFGIFFRFSNKKMHRTLNPTNRKIAKGNELTEHNLKEWIKFQKYAERNL